MKLLICGCCGNQFKGKQHPEKDKGYGTCRSCQEWILNKPGLAIGHPIQEY